MKRLSIVRGGGLTREAAEKFYDLVQDNLKNYNLYDKSQNIFNGGQLGIQLINKVEKVVARKGTKVVNKITTGKKARTVSMVVCASPDGKFLPPLFKKQF